MNNEHPIMTECQYGANLLTDLEEKIADNFFKLGLTQKDVDNFFKFLVQSFDPLLNTISITRHRQRFNKSWQRFLEGIRLCVNHMYLIVANNNRTGAAKALVSSK